MMLYECGVRYERTMENGMTKKVTELYLVDALSFAEAEGRITNEMEPYISGEFDVVTIKRTNISEIVEGCPLPTNGSRLNSCTSPLTRKQARRRNKRFTSSSVPPTINNAHICVVEHMKGSVMDYEIATLDETKIMDLFRYKVNTSDNG